MRTTFLTAILLTALMMGCQSHNYTNRGLATGGLGGAGLGAVIGEIASDEPLAGAAIGGAVGALTGATVGSGLDDIDAASRARVASQAAYNQPLGTNMNEIISMSNAGLSDQIISRHIRNEGFAYSLDAGDLIALRQQGVSDNVIADLQNASSQPATVAVASAQQYIEPPTVFVQERYHTVPVYGGPRRYRRGPIRRPSRGPRGTHWGISFGL